jgi:hypothetical protein
VALGDGTYAGAPLAGYGGYGGYGVRSTPVGPLGRVSSLSVRNPDEYVLQYGPFGECSALCGEGTEERSLACVSKTYGNPVELTRCSVKLADLQQMSRPCTAAP